MDAGARPATTSVFLSLLASTAAVGVLSAVVYADRFATAAFVSLVASGLLLVGGAVGAQPSRIEASP
jgi:hypothetical protein